MVWRFLTVLSVLVMVSSPALAFELFEQDCTVWLDKTNAALQNKKCAVDTDCTLYNPPPCGCRTVAGQVSAAQTIIKALDVCSRDIVCESCLIPKMETPVRATCQQEKCVVTQAEWGYTIGGVQLSLDVSPRSVRLADIGHGRARIFLNLRAKNHTNETMAFDAAPPITNLSALAWQKPGGEKGVISAWKDVIEHMIIRPGMNEYKTFDVTTHLGVWDYQYNQNTGRQELFLHDMKKGVYYLTWHVRDPQNELVYTSNTVSFEVK